MDVLSYQARCGFSGIGGKNFRGSGWVESGSDPSQKKITATERLIEAHYRDIRGLDHFDEIVKFMVSGPLMAMVLTNPHSPGSHTSNIIPGTVVWRLRRLIGSFQDTIPGTIRHDLMIPGRPRYENLIHGSDSIKSADREIGIWFPELDWDEATFVGGVLRGYGNRLGIDDIVRPAMTLASEMILSVHGLRIDFPE